DFRQAAYDLLVKANDATFELMDAVMTTPNASSLAEFSLNPLFSSSMQERLRSVTRHKTRPEKTHGVVSEAITERNTPNRTHISSN
ncbi:hypothetical protein, partial [Microcoleus sp. PH2017_15_JOR_U_A]|uniref:hypothetical protein n=1 Tax=Microcoleus sp. PH2017_15_JOR_U_A TaxID=2798826 RepID=UPI0025D77763